jgi:hypothetical protein
MPLNISNTTVSSDGSNFVVNNGTTNVINGTSGPFLQTNGARYQSQNVALGNNWFELPGMNRGNGQGYYRRAAKAFSGNGDNDSQVNNIFRATPNNGWSQNVVYYKIYGGGYQGTHTGEYYINSDGSAQGTWTPLQYTQISGMGGVGAPNPTISSITKSGTAIDVDFFTYTVSHTMPRWSSTVIEIEWLNDYFSPVTSITGIFQIALL